MIYLDTHVVAWLYAGRLDLFPAATRGHLEGDDEILISPMVALELDFLHEIGRVREPSPPVLAALRSDLGLRICELPFELVVAAAREETWTRDPFDRLIVAHAAARRAPLVTRDGRIRESYPRSLWDQESTDGAAGQEWAGQESAGPGSGAGQPVRPPRGPRRLSPSRRRR